MDMYTLENMVKKNKPEFVKLVKDINKKKGLEAALQMIKKSGICINHFGTGKPKENNLFKESVQILREYYPDSNKLRHFEEEVEIINKLYRDFTVNHLDKVVKSLKSDIHVISYIIALELSLIDYSNTQVNFFNQRTSNLNDFRADVFENILTSAGSVLQYFSHKKFPFKGTTTRIAKQDIHTAGKHIKLSELKILLDTIQELWSYFEVDVSISDNIAFKAKGNHALGKNITHLSFMDIRNAKMSRYSLQEVILNFSYTKTDKLPPNEYISSNEEMTCEFIKEYFSIEDLTTEFNGISLAELIRAYSVVSLECFRFLKNRKLKYNFKELTLNDVCIVKSKYKWINYFREAGIRKNKAEKILYLMTFNNSSIDLCDCPFIEVDGYYVIVPSLSAYTDPSRAILSNLNRKKISVSIKGDKFEEEIRNSVRSAGIKCIQLKKKNYECDSVFNIGDDIYFVEAKNLNHPTTYREYMRNLDEILDACSQLNRIAVFYTKNIQIVKEKLGINKVNNIYKIVVTNTCQGEKICFNEVYVTDSTCFEGYFRRRPSQVHSVKGNVLISTPLFEEFYQGNISSQQFISFLETSPHLELNKKRITQQTFDYTNQLGVKLTDFFTKVNTIVPIDYLSESELNELDKIYGSPLNSSKELHIW